MFGRLRSIEIDNSAAERALRVVALGRKNYPFAGSDAGGERAAAVDSLLGSAKLNDLDPELYLRHVLERIADHPPGGPGLAFETWGTSAHEGAEMVVGLKRCQQTERLQIAKFNR
jgi:hypothetical protein